MKYKISTVEDAFGELKAIHNTHKLKDAESIVTNGFNMKKFNYTAKSHNADEYLYKHDPFAIFSSPNDCHMIEKGTPYVRFDINSKAKILIHDQAFTGFKKQMYAELGAKDPKDFTKKLKIMGIDAICDHELVGEIIILNTNIIKFTEAGLLNEIKINIEIRNDLSI